MGSKLIKRALPWVLLIAVGGVAWHSAAHSELVCIPLPRVLNFAWSRAYGHSNQGAVLILSEQYTLRLGTRQLEPQGTLWRRETMETVIVDLPKQSPVWERVVKWRRVDDGADPNPLDLGFLTVIKTGVTVEPFTAMETASIAYH